MQKRLLILLSIGVALCSFVRAEDQDVLSDSFHGTEALPAALVRGVEEAYNVNKLGLDVLEKGNLDSAAMYFSKAQSLLPLYSDAQNNAGVVQYRRGNIGQAILIWKSVLQKDPLYSVSYYNLGIVSFDEKNYMQCEAYLKKAIGINKKFVEALIMLGRVELLLDKKRDALDQFKTAYKIAPNQSETWQFLSYAYLKNKDTANGESLLLKHQDNAVALKILGQISSARKDSKSALGYYSKAVSSGGSQELLLDCAVAQLDARNCKDALFYLKKYAENAKEQSADAYLYSGIASKDCGDVNAARISFEKGVAQYPSDQILRYNLGQIYFQLKQFDQAEMMWNSVADSLDDPSLSYLRSINARRKGNLDLAEKLIRNAIKRDERPEYLDMLGTIYYAKGKKDSAIVYFKKALKLDPELRSAQLNLALSTQSKDEVERATIEVEKALESCKNNCAEQVLQLSILYYHQAKVDKAAKLLEKAILTDRSEKTYRHLALYYKELREWEKAIKILEKAKSLFVLDVQTEYELAEDYLLFGDNRKAIEALTVLLEKWDGNPWRLYYQLGYACMEIKEFDKAKKYLEISIKKKPDNLAAQGLIAYIYNAEGNVSQARSLWEKNIASDPNNATLQINMGLSLEKDCRFEEALRYYQKALSIKPDDKDIHINIGNAYAGMERNADAMKEYALALNSSKRNLAAYDMFLIAQKTGLEGKASELLGIMNTEFPSSPYTKRAQADMLLDKKDTINALVKLESLGEKDPGDFLTLARVYAAQKNNIKAAQYLSQLPTDTVWDKARIGVKAQMAFMSGDYSTAYEMWKSLGDSGITTQYNMALSAYNAKNYNDVIALAEKIVGKAQGIERADVCMLAGNSAMASKQWNKAMQWYQQLENVRQKDALVKYNLAVITYNLNNMEESWTYYQKARELDSKYENKDIEKRYQSLYGTNTTPVNTLDSLDIWYNDAVALQVDKKDTLAESTYKKILEKSPTYFRAWNNLGTIYSERGELTKALDCYLKSIEKQHDMPEAYANLVTIYTAMENYKEAQRWIVKGLGHNPDDQVLKGWEAKVRELAKKKK